MRHLRRSAPCLVSSLTLLVTCSAPSELRRFPIDSDGDYILESGEHHRVEFDASLSSDGNGSLLVQDLWPGGAGVLSMGRAKTIEAKLVESGDVDVEGVRLTYRAMIRVGDFMNAAPRLTMLIHYPEYEEDEYDIVWNQPGLGEMLTPAQPGPGGWTAKEVVYELQDGEIPDNVLLAVQWNARGGFEPLRADDIVLLRSPRTGLACNAQPIVEMAQELVADQPGADQLVCPPGERCPRFIVCPTE